MTSPKVICASYTTRLIRSTGGHFVKKNLNLCRSDSGGIVLTEAQYLSLEVNIVGQYPFLLTRLFL